VEGAIRVWLEPGYDHGRTGAWMLDWPGAFAWGETRAGSLARVQSAVHRYNDWLAEHDESSPAPPIGGIQIVQEVAAYRRDGGYEVNAIFTKDDRTVTNREMETMIRRLGFARDDLLAIAVAARDFIDGGGRLEIEERSPEAEASGAATGRDVDGILRHVAGAEPWFVSRLQPDVRYAGPREPLDAYLAESRTFLVEGLQRMHRLQSRGRLAPRADGKGEFWTLAKVLRRALYHSLDHLEELDRRLARADGRIDRLELRKNAAIDPVELRALFVASGMTGRAHDSEELTARVVSGSTETVSAWDGERLIGFARILSDEATNALISTVAVAPRWQDRGLGRRLMRALMEGRESLKLMLDAREGTEAFYERLGFNSVSTARVRPRGGRA
jgi:ribosomal protein S18 acetylase RimI-like enzyme